MTGVAPCPFCGGRDAEPELKGTPNGVSGYFACSACGAQGPWAPAVPASVWPHIEAERAAFELWNKRAAEGRS